MERTYWNLFWALLCLGCVSAAAAPRAGAPVSGRGAAFTVIVLPDTQYAIESYPEVFEAQMEWIASNVEALDIRFVIHLGDVTEHNTTSEWTRARAGYELIEGLVPYSILPGNHDMGNGTMQAPRDTSHLNAFFPLALQETLPSFGGSFASAVDNTYHLFSAGGVDWLVLSLEFGPRVGVLAWAESVLEEHSNRQAIVASHTHLYADSEHHTEHQPWNPHLYAIAEEPGGASDGEEVWQVLRAHPNVRFILNGHALDGGVGYLEGTGNAANRVHQLLSNYQQLPEGGSGYLRILEFRPGENQVEVSTYSPWLDQFLEDPANSFTLPWIAGSFEPGSTIFSDGFESGDWAAWSEVAP